MEISFTTGGRARCVYSDGMDLSFLGRPKIRRASHVEPTEDATWTADMRPSGGPVLGPFPTRGEALEAEMKWLRENNLGKEE